jgi:biopolymer transport protein ExbD
MTRRAILSGESAEEMWGTKRRKTEETDIDVTPLVDCVFLLLSFFMLTSPMGNQNGKLPSAAHGIGVDPNGTTAIRIAEGDPTPKIILDKHEGTLDDVRPYVEAGVRKGHMLVVIKADRKVPCGLVQKVAKAATSVEGVQFSLGVQDKKPPQ